MFYLTTKTINQRTKNLVPLSGFKPELLSKYVPKTYGSINSPIKAICAVRETQTLKSFDAIF